MVGVENIEGKCRLRSPVRRGVPADAQELAIVLDPPNSFCTRAKLHVDTMDSVIVDDDNGSSC